MIRRCIVCGLVYGEKEPYSDRSVSHGICGSCWERLKGRGKVSALLDVVDRLVRIAEYLVRSQESVYLVSPDGRDVAIVTDNKVEVREKDTGRKKEDRVFTSREEAVKALQSQGWK